MFQRALVLPRLSYVFEQVSYWSIGFATGNFKGHSGYKACVCVVGMGENVCC